MEGPGAGQIVPVDGTQWGTPPNRRAKRLSPQQHRLADRAQQKALCRQLQKINDSEEGMSALLQEGQEWVNKYLNTSANSAKKRMRDIWMHCHMDLDQAGIVMSAERTAYKDDQNVGEWMNKDHLRYIYICIYIHISIYNISVYIHIS